MRTCKVFIASPDDVKDEREIVREVCGHLNETSVVEKRGIPFEPIDWEGVLPSAGRPQDGINPLLEGCEIFACIFYRKFGSPTGLQESGTLEEFRLAYDSWKNCRKPHILFYFKEPGDIPGNSMEALKQAMKVRQLREWIKTDHILTYTSFNTSGEFRKLFREHVKLWIEQQEVSEGGDREDMKSEPADNIPSTKSLEDYRELLRQKCIYMELDKLREKGEVIQVRLPDVFIPLYAYDPHGRNKGAGGKGLEREEPRSVEELAAEYDYLLIEGQPGSGKTTLMRRLAHGLCEKGVKGSAGYFPVLIFLKDLRGFFEARESGMVQPRAEDILGYHFNKSCNTDMTPDALKSFCGVSGVMIILDGLDEIPVDYRDPVVTAFAEFRIKNKGVKVILAGRPHGLSEVVQNRFGKNHVKILDLNPEQVEMFIRKWFEHAYLESGEAGKTSAEGMLGEIKSHPSIGKLIDNPLMLTAICILYHDGKSLPGQRAELYKKFVDNVVYRRFGDDENVKEFLMLLAFDMHDKSFKGADKSFVLERMAQVYKAGEGESKKEHRRRIEKLFDEIEPKCGLLMLEGGQYRFWHLTFQEFLCAQYIMTNNIEYSEAIKDYWPDDWYREVIQLYIGLLSMANKRWANHIVSKAVEVDDAAPYNQWLIASKALEDMHDSRRDSKVVKKSKKRLEIIMKSKAEPKVRAEAGETLGWLGDERDLTEFVEFDGGDYELEGLGKVEVKPFKISKFPVTNIWFEEFVKAGGYENQEWWSKEGKKWLEHTGVKYSAGWHDRKWNCPNLPVVGVSWYEAYAFCKWLNEVRNDGYEYSLPSEVQWQAAAAGFEGRKYPWGDEWDETKCNNKEIKLEKTSAVGIFEEGHTPEGISDLSGNVWEWTVSDYETKKVVDDFRFDKEVQRLYDAEKYEDAWKKYRKDNKYLNVLRGGSWYYSSEYCNCGFRDDFYPFYRVVNIGFRCSGTHLVTL